MQLTSSQIVTLASSGLLLLLMLIVYLRRKESGFLSLLIAQAVSFSLELFAQFCPVQLPGVVLLALGYIPTILILVGWVLLAFKGSKKGD
jgi:hypothetical protein